MQNLKIKYVIALVVLLSLAGLAFASTPSARTNDDHRAPDLPPGCSDLQVPSGHKVAFRTYALGVQIYKWNGTSWEFVAPWALLFTDANFHGKVGLHYAGPTWESRNGSKVVGKRVAGCTPDMTAIPWLRLEATATEGPGIFSRVTYIQRVYTAGGLAPTTPGAFVGAEARVPYTTEYYFYRAEN
jgi:hypothetical protein